MNKIKLVPGVAAVLVLALSGCGSDNDAGSKPHSTNETVASVLQKLEGTSGEARRAKLIDMAKAEGGTLNVYTATPEGVVKATTDAFEADTGIKLKVYRAGNEDIEQRVVQEAKANYGNQADVILDNDEAMYSLSAAGLLEPFSTPVADGIAKDVISKDWVGTYFAPFVAAWNTDHVKTAPTSWKEFLTQNAGKLGLLDVDADWFASIVQALEEQDGMTETEAVNLFKKAAKGSQVVSGHTLVGTLLASGQIDATGSAYSFTINDLKKKGAPVEWEPPVLPIVATFGAVGINKATDQPASSLLWIEWNLTDGMKVNLDAGSLDPTNPTYGGTLAKYLANGDIKVRDIKYVTTESKKWQALYQQVLHAAG